jgi:hypothetical protein
MFGLFRKKNADGSDKLPGPKGVPDAVGSTLVVKFQEDPAWAWALKVAMKPRDEKDQFDIRVFSDSMAASAKVSVKDYHSLDDHPNLILYDGIYDKKNRRVQLQMKYKKTS